MEYRGIDVSSWQGVIDWKKVADHGTEFAIIRITEVGNAIDRYFERNYAGCMEYRIPTGVYKFSYALSIDEVRREAEKVIEVLKGRKLQFPVFLDLEYSNQRRLGTEMIARLAEAFRRIIVDAGYRFGIYCNLDWYRNVISEELKKYDFWIARYPVDDNGTLIERYRPDIGVGWQYTSKGRIPGIEGYVDRDVFYKNYVAEEPSDKEKLSKEPKFVGKVTASALNVRTGAGTEYPNLREYPLLKRDNLIDVCDTREAIDGTKWYYVRIAGKYFGFVAARYIRCEMTPTSVGDEQQISINGGSQSPI